MSDHSEDEKPVLNKHGHVRIPEDKDNDPNKITKPKDSSGEARLPDVQPDNMPGDTEVTSKQLKRD